MHNAHTYSRAYVAQTTALNSFVSFVGYYILHIIVAVSFISWPSHREFLVRSEQISKNFLEKILTQQKFQEIPQPATVV